MWLKALEIAIVEKDVQKIEALLNESLSHETFATVDEMKKAQYLLLEASKLLNELKNQSEATMKQLKKNMDFMKVSEQKSPNRLDIRS